MENWFCDMTHKDEYSVRNGIGNIKNTIPILKERGQKYYAIANYMEVSNWVGQYFECKKNGIIPILGFETFINNYRYNAEDNTVTCYEIGKSWKKDFRQSFL